MPINPDRPAAYLLGLPRGRPKAPLPCCICGEHGADVRCYRWYEAMIKRASRLGYEMKNPQWTHVHQSCVDRMSAWLRGSR